MPTTLPPDMVPPSKRKHGASLAGGVGVMSSTVIPGTAAAGGSVVPGAAVPLVPSIPAVPMSTAGRTSPTTVSHRDYCDDVNQFC